MLHESSLPMKDSGFKKKHQLWADLTSLEAPLMIVEGSQWAFCAGFLSVKKKKSLKTGRTGMLIQRFARFLRFTNQSDSQIRGTKS